MKASFFRVAVILCLVLLPGAVSAAEVRVGDLSLSAAWARATAGGGGNGAAYLVIANQGTAPDRVVSAAAPVASRVELHTHLMEGGVMRMRQVEGIDIAPGARVELKPQGLHVMLLGLKAPLKEGESFPLTLTFQSGGKATVEVRVGTVSASGDEHQHHH